MISRSGLGRSQGWQGAVQDDGQPPSAMEGVEAGRVKEADAAVERAALGQGFRAEGEARRRESVLVREKPKVFEDLDLYDPDEE